MGIYQFGDSHDFTASLSSNRSDVEQYNSRLSIHNDESADLRLARQEADEMINISGAEVKVFPRTDNPDHDKVWDEDADPTYWNPKTIKAFFKPEPLESELNGWGVDTPNSSEVVFSHRQVILEFGNRMLRAGDVIQLPFNSMVLKPKNYRVLNATPTGNFRYHWLYITCKVEVLTADITVRVEDDMPAFTPMEEGYRESI